MSSIGTKYLFLCKENYLNGITPADKQSLNSDGYYEVIKIAKHYFRTNEIKVFSFFFQEYQYLVNLWTAHMILEYGEPDKILKDEALEIIYRYANSSHNAKLANDEKRWLIDRGYIK